MKAQSGMAVRSTARCGRFVKRRDSTPISSGRVPSIKRNKLAACSPTSPGSASSSLSAGARDRSRRPNPLSTSASWSGSAVFSPSRISETRSSSVPARSIDASAPLYPGPGMEVAVTQSAPVAQPKARDNTAAMPHLREAGSTSGQMGLIIRAPQGLSSGVVGPAAMSSRGRSSRCD